MKTLIFCTPDTSGVFKSRRDIYKRNRANGKCRILVLKFEEMTAFGIRGGILEYNIKIFKTIKAIFYYIHCI
jgi:hypothetical protein